MRRSLHGFGYYQYWYAVWVLGGASWVNAAGAGAMQVRVSICYLPRELPKLDLIDTQGPSTGKTDSELSYVVGSLAEAPRKIITRVIREYKAMKPPTGSGPALVYKGGPFQEVAYTNAISELENAQEIVFPCCRSAQVSINSYGAVRGQKGVSVSFVFKLPRGLKGPEFKPEATVGEVAAVFLAKVGAFCNGLTEVKLDAFCRGYKPSSLSKRLSRGGVNCVGLQTYSDKPPGTGLKLVSGGLNLDEELSKQKKDSGLHDLQIDLSNFMKSGFPWGAAFCLGGLVALGVVGMYQNYREEKHKKKERPTLSAWQRRHLEHLYQEYAAKKEAKGGW